MDPVSSQMAVTASRMRSPLRAMRGRRGAMGALMHGVGARIVPRIHAVSEQLSPRRDRVIPRPRVLVSFASPCRDESRDAGTGHGYVEVMLQNAVWRRAAEEKARLILEEESAVRKLGARKQVETVTVSEPESFGVFPSTDEAQGQGRLRQRQRRQLLLLPGYVPAMASGRLTGQREPIASF
jgi:hypothetical protein